MLRFFRQRALALALAGIALTTACSTGKKVGAKQATSLSRMDSVAYAFGLINGEAFARVIATVPGDSLSRKQILAGLSDRLEQTANPRLTMEAARSLFQSYVKEVQERENKVLMSQNDSVLQANKLKPGVETTTSGLQYRVLKAGNGAKVTSEQDTVVVHYEGKLINGKTFDSSYERQQPATFPLNQVIQGWTEGIKLMNVGAKYEFYIPYQLAYGERGAGTAIPPYSTLIFDVELLDVLPYKEEVTKVEASVEEKTSPADTKIKKRSNRKAKK